jgi:hypothetical protein
MRLAKAHRTIGLRIRINRHDGASVRCSGSNRPDQPNGSCPFTPPSKTRSTSNAISYLAARSASSETKHSGRGEPPLRREAQRAFQTSRHRNQVGVTAPTFAIDIVGADRFNTLIGAIFLIIVFVSPDGILGLWRRVQPALAQKALREA